MIILLPQSASLPQSPTYFIIFDISSNFAAKYIQVKNPDLLCEYDGRVVENFEDTGADRTGAICIAGGGNRPHR
jgi:hypothetical protein